MRELPMTLPPHLHHPEVEKAAEHYRKMLGVEREARDRVGALVGELETARRADPRLAADAIRTGRKTPKLTVATVETKLTDANRHVTAAEQAVSDARDELLEAGRRDRAAWQKACEDRAAGAREALRSELDTLEQRLHELGDAWGELSFVQTFPGLGFKPAALTLRSLQLPSGEYPGPAYVLHALRSLTENPGPRSDATGWPAGGGQRIQVVENETELPRSEVVLNADDTVNVDATVFRRDRDECRMQATLTREGSAS